MYNLTINQSIYIAP